MSLAKKDSRGRQFYGNYTGEDFSNTDLRGADFSGATLINAKFVNTDIRGVNFSDAKLKGADFTSATGGLKPTWTKTLGILIFAIAAVCGIFSVVAGNFAAFPFVIGISNENFYPAPGLKVYEVISDLSKQRVTVSLIVYVGCFLSFINRAIRKGFRQSLNVIGWSLVVAIPLLIFGAILGFYVWQDTNNTSLLQNLAGYPLAFCVGLLAFIVSGIITQIVSITLATVISVSEIIVGKKIAAFVKITTLIFSLIWSLSGSVMVAFSVAEAGHSARTSAFAVAMAWGTTGLIIVLGNYAANQAFNDETQFRFIRQIAIRLATYQGTNFQHADLKEVSFTGANLKSCNFARAKIPRTNFRGAKHLDQARLDQTYLDRPKVLQIATTGNGHNQVLSNLDLQGIYLKGADLSGAFFVQTKLADADLSESDLTGACIDNWDIQRTTKLEGIACKYVFMRYQDGDKRNRIPLGNEEFNDNGFENFVRSLLDTLDLYHKQDFDPVASLLALKELRKKHKELLTIVVLENRDNGFLIKIQTSGRNENITLERDYFDRYKIHLNSASKLTDTFPQEENKFLTVLSNLVEQLKREPGKGIYLSYANMIVDKRNFTTTAGGSMSINTINIEEGAIVMGSNIISGITGGQGDITIGGQGDVIISKNTNGPTGEFENITNSFNTVPDSAEKKDLKLEDLIQQVKVEIEKNPNLDEEFKQLALEQLDKIKKLGSDPQAPDFQAKAKKAETYMKSINELIGNAGGLVKTVQPLFSGILSWFGINV